MKLRTETAQQRIDRIEAERIAKSNAKRELDMQRVYVGECDLHVHQTRERISELRKEIAEVEKQAARRERKLAQAKAKLAVMESQ